MSRVSNKNSKAVVAAAAPAKVGKVVKGKPAAAAKPEKADKVAAPRRSQFAGLTISLTEAGKAATPRGSAGAIFAAIGKGGPVDKVIGTPYARPAGKYTEGESTVNSGDLAYFEKRGLISMA